MTPDTKANRIALEPEAEVNSACVLRINDYMSRTGLTVQDFAHRIGYGHSTMRLFLTGNYHNVGRSAVQLVKTATAFMDAHPIGEQAQILGDLYETANVQLIKQTFAKLLENPVAYMIYAPPGSQKSFVLEHQVAELNRSEISKPNGCRAFYIYARNGIRPRDLIRRVAVACGSRNSSDIEPMIQNIRFDFRNQRVVLVIDEAQHLSIDCFEVLRELLDRPPYFSLLFAGSHDLKAFFDKLSATLEQWNSRIIAKVLLPGLQPDEARAIILREIGDRLEGLDESKQSTLMNTLIDRATVQDAYAAKRKYINIRSLTNSLRQLKMMAPQS
jgi:type II secretory pathway predicted ATPase ExeA